MPSVIEIFGRIHPMLVHFPIGILLLSIALLWLEEKQRLNVSHGVVSFSLGVSAVTATLSCITGYILSSSGDYNSNSVDLHLWIAVLLTLGCWATWYLHYEYWLRDRVLTLTTVMLVGSLIGTGHLGAALTHGEEFLWEPLTKQQEEVPQKDLSLLDSQALFYPEVIAPILSAKCTGCHGAAKQKGKLRLDSYEAILKGGKSRASILADSPDESELLTRIELPVADEDHMPPQEKKQLSQAETELLRIWIAAGAPVDARVADVVSGEEWRKLLASLEEAPPPSVDVVPPDPALVNSLIAKGVAITPIAKDSTLLSVNFVSVPQTASALLKELSTISSNVVQLKLTGCLLTDSSREHFSSFRNLTHLSLDDTAVGDSLLSSISQLPSLTYLNLKGTHVTSQGVLKLQVAKQLRELFLYQTQVTEVERSQIQSLLPRVRIDFGNYAVPTLTSDTTIVKQTRK